MMKTGKDDLNDIINEIRGGSGRKPVQNSARGKGKGKGKERQPEQKIYLLLGLLVILGGIGYVIYDNRVTQVAESTEEDDNAAAQANPSSNNGDGGSFNGGGGGGGGGSAADARDKLPLPIESFHPAEALKDSGSDYEVWVLLKAPLDSYTEGMWRRAGLLRNEGGSMLSPYIRRVTVNNRASLDYLVDWHVDLAAEVPPPPKN
jgi:hypothetical protein